jgi:hypothetical protein
MLKETIAIGKDVVEAKENARLALGCSELDDVQFEILHMGSKGILGIIGVKPAKVKAFIEIPDAQPKRQRHERKDSRKPDGENAAKNEAKPRNEQAKPKNKPNKNKNNSCRAEAESHLSVVFEIGFYVGGAKLIGGEGDIALFLQSGNNAIRVGVIVDIQ